MSTGAYNIEAKFGLFSLNWLPEESLFVSLCTLRTRVQRSQPSLDNHGIGDWKGCSKNWSELNRSARWVIHIHVSTLIASARLVVLILQSQDPTAGTYFKAMREHKSWPRTTYEIARFVRSSNGRLSLFTSKKSGIACRVPSSRGRTVEWLKALTVLSQWEQVSNIAVRRIYQSLHCVRRKLRVVEKWPINSKLRRTKTYANHTIHQRKAFILCGH